MINIFFFSEYSTELEKKNISPSPKTDQSMNSTYMSSNNKNKQVTERERDTTHTHTHTQIHYSIKTYIANIFKAKIAPELYLDFS